MRRQPVFIGAVTLIAILLLMIYGISALSPTADTDDVSGNGFVRQDIDRPSIDFANPSIGPADAPLTVVVYSDYLCSNCATMQATLIEVLPKFADDIRFVWKDLPNTNLHPQARNAAKAARCADDQDSFWEYHDLLFARTSTVQAGSFSELAGELGLDTAQFDKCVTDTRAEALVQRDVEEAVSLGVDATPYMFIGDKRVSGAMTPIQFEATLRTQLAAVNAE